MQRCEMGSKRFDTLSDYVRHRRSLRVDCLHCKRFAVLEPMALGITCSARGWSRDMRAVEARLRCSHCGSRKVNCCPIKTR